MASRPYLPPGSITNGYLAQNSVSTNNIFYNTNFEGIWNFDSEVFLQNINSGNVDFGNITSLGNNYGNIQITKINDDFYNVFVQGNPGNYQLQSVLPLLNGSLIGPLEQNDLSIFSFDINNNFTEVFQTIKDSGNTKLFASMILTK